MDGYQWFGHNMTVLSGRAISGSGGVGFLIPHEILKQYKAEVTDKSTEGILWLTLTMKDNTDIGLLLCLCYLPPEGSSRGNVSREFYDFLLSQLFLHYDGNPTVILGDYNGRIGMKGDCDVPDIPQRTPIDNVCNQFGDNLIEFLSDSNSCVLNRRFDSGKDNYTYVSARGRSVVDYVIVIGCQLDDWLPA